jgi:hypothetical protein
MPFLILSKPLLHSERALGWFSIIRRIAAMLQRIDAWNSAHLPIYEPGLQVSTVPRMLIQDLPGKFAWGNLPLVEQQPDY